MMRGRGRESKNVSGPVLEKDSLSVDWDLGPASGRADTGGMGEAGVRLGMVAQYLMKTGRKSRRMKEIRRIQSTGQNRVG